MYIIEVIPISRGIGLDTLSYFTNKAVSLGDIVEIIIRNKKVSGIVISIKKAEDIKSEIKNADFSLKKIEKIKNTSFFTPYFMNMVSNVAEYYATNIGNIMSVLVPKYLLDNIGKLKTEKKDLEPNNNRKKILKDKYVIQGDDEERYSTWKSLIRQEFAKKKSLLFIMPTIEHVEYAFKIFEKGIEGYIYILHGSLKQKEIIENWNNIIEEKHPVVIIATGGFLSIPRQDIETLVVESENNKAYKIPRRPFLDIRNICEIFAVEKGIKLFFSDSLLRVETIWRESEGLLVQASPFKFRTLNTSSDLLIDMKKYKTTNANFKIISDEVEETIINTKNNSQHMIILATRRGMAPTTVCGDCQNIVVCNNCSAPVVLHKTDDKSFFMCHRCGERRSTEEYCKICGSWKLGTIGIGIDLVIEKIKDKFPNIDIFKIDSDTKNTERSIKSTIQKFRAKPGSILIGTEMMLPYIHEKVENSTIISIDSLFALPDFRIEEKILQILIKMRALTAQNFIVQTRKSNEKVFDYGLKGNMIDFYKNTIEERKKFNYPPFSILIKITLEGKKEKIVEEMKETQNILDPYEVEVFPAFTHTIKGNYVLHGLMRLPIDKWPNVDLNSKLRSLPPSVIIKVDPETLL